jgi:hypothetical protein
LSSSLAACEAFLKKDYSGKLTGIIYLVKAFSAKDISYFSNFILERESIFLPAVKLKVLSKKISPIHKGLYTIEMEEIHTVSDDKLTALQATTTLPSALLGAPSQTR